MQAKSILLPLLLSIIPTFAAAQSYEAFLDSTDNYIKRERWSDAARCIRKSLSLKPASPLNSKLFCNLGICLTNMNDYPAASEAFEISLVRDPKSPRTYSARAILHTLQNNTDAAISDLDQSLALDSLQQAPLRLRGQLLLVKNNSEAALADFRTLRRLFPDDPWGAAGQGECFVNREDYASAIPYFEDALKIEDAIDFYIPLIYSCLATNRLADAEDAIRKALAKYPTEGELYLQRGILHKNLYQNSDMEIDKKLAREYGVDTQMIERFLPSTPK